tara:strand:- start:3890 stop:4426 length:537 start_codon:yes stop_codon:yes gene_type:complete
MPAQQLVVEFCFSSLSDEQRLRVEGAAQVASDGLQMAQARLGVGGGWSLGTLHACSCGVLVARVVYNSGIQKVINDLGLAANAVAQRLGKVGLCGLAGLASGQSVARFEYHPRCTASGCKEAGALPQSRQARTGNRHQVSGGAGREFSSGKRSCQRSGIQLPAPRRVWRGRRPAAALV